MLRRDFLAGTSLAATFAAAGVKLAWPRTALKNILDYGARGDGRTLNTRAIQRALDGAYQEGGGVVHVPAGTFLTGRLELKSRVTLYLDAGATLLGSTSMSDYQGESGSGENARHLIYASNADQVSLSGPGRIDGQGASFWEPSGRPPLPPDRAWADVASHALKPKASGHPSPMVLFASCRGVRVDGVRLENSPGWTLHLLDCDDVRVTGIEIANPVNGPNTDGIDVTCCQDVTISGCSIATGDDAICLKSQSPPGTEPRLVKNITVTGCTLSTCCNGFKIGTDSQGGFEKIVFSDSVIRNGAVPLAERVISGVALEMIDGGWIDGVEVTNIKMQRARTAVFIRLGNRKRVHDDPQHGLRRVTIKNIQAAETVLASSITGIPGDMVDAITLSNLRMQNALASPRSVADVPEKESAYPEARMFGMLPVSGLYVRHARNLRFDGLEIAAAKGESRPTLLFDDVDSVRLAGFKSTPVSGAMALVKMVNSRDVTIADSAAPAGTGTFVSVSGSSSANIVLAGDDLGGARHGFQADSDVAAGTVRIVEKAPPQGE